MKETIHMVLRVLTPVFVGCGQKLLKKEYIYIPNENRVYVPDRDRFFSWLQERNLVDAYTDFILSSDNSLYQWLLSQKASKEEIRGLYIIHYFGVPHLQETVDKIKQLADKYNLVIVEDLTQTLLCGKNLRIGFGDYVVSSVRKWFPIADGGIAAARNDAAFDMPDITEDEDASIVKQMELSLLKCCYEKGTITDIAPYLQMEKDANKSRYIDFNPRKITECSRIILEKCDIEEAVRKRCENYRYLYDRLKEIPGITMKSKKLPGDNTFVPFGLLIETEEREKLYNFLAQHMIVGEIQWQLATQYYTPSEQAAYISEHSLMIQTDQRYDKEDMDYIYQTISEFFKTM